MERSKQALLVLAAQQGNEAAFTELVKNYQQPLIRFAFRLCQDLALAKDATQDTWLKAAKGLKSLSDPEAFKAWLFTLLRHQIVDLQRALKPTLGLEQAPEGQVELLLPASDPVWQRLFPHLSFIDKQCLYLFYTEEMTVYEIAQILCVPIGTVKSRLNRARKRFKDLLEKERTKDDEYRSAN